MFRQAKSKLALFSMASLTYSEREMEAIIRQLPNPKNPLASPEDKAVVELLKHIKAFVGKCTLPEDEGEPTIGVAKIRNSGLKRIFKSTGIAGVEDEVFKILNPAAEALKAATAYQTQHPADNQVLSAALDYCKQAVANRLEKLKAQKDGIYQVYEKVDGDRNPLKALLSDNVQPTPKT